MCAQGAASERSLAASLSDNGLNSGNARIRLEGNFPVHPPPPRGTSRALLSARASDSRIQGGRMMAIGGNVIEFPPATSDDGIGFIRIAPGQYHGTYVRHNGMTVFRRPKLRVLFRLFEYPELILPRWYRVTSYDGARISAPMHSDLVREVSAALGLRVRPDRVPVASMADIRVSLIVRPVGADREDNALAPVNCYEVVSRVHREV